MVTSLTSNTLTLNSKTLSAPWYNGTISLTGDYCYAGGSGTGTYGVSGPHGNAPQIGSLFIGVNTSRSEDRDGYVSLSGTWWYGEAYGISTFNSTYGSKGTSASINLGAASLCIAVRVS